MRIRKEVGLRLCNTATAAMFASGALLVANASAETLALRHFTLIDGTGHQPLANASMIVQDGRIQWVGPDAQMKPAPGSKVVDLAGKYVIPGLIDNHVHLALVNGIDQNINYYTADNVDRQLKIYAAYGVTSVQVLGTDRDIIYGIRDAGRARPPQMARVWTAGRGVVFKGSYGGVAGLPAQVATPEEARAMVDQQVKNGADIIKFWMDDEFGTISSRMPYAISKAVIDEGHKLHRKVLAHVFYLANAKELVREGVDGFAHEVRDQPVDPGLVDGMKSHRVWQMAATLSREASFTYDKLPFLDDPFFSRGVTPEVVSQLGSPQRVHKLASAPLFPKYKVSFANAMANFRKEADAGVRYGMGTDSGPSGRFPGYFAHWEMELMVKAGRTPLQVLTAATGDNAAFMGAKEVGTLQPSKWADMVVLDKNPLADIRNTRAIRAVYIAGKPVPTIWNTCVARQASACTGGPDEAAPPVPAGADHDLEKTGFVFGPGSK
jgi:imidazolonepropionase-like amidohydrolase